MKKSFFWMVALITFSSVTVLAQSPQAFNYQGIARDGSGSPLTNQPVSLRFSILQGSQGVSVFQETHNITTTKLGTFSVEIGNGAFQIGLFDDIDWGSSAYYIKTEMDPDGGANYILLGESQLLSVPYALYAGSKSDPWQENTSGIHYTDGNVGIGTNLPISKLSIEGMDDNGIGRNYINLKNQSTSNRSLVWLSLAAGESNSTTSLQHFSETYDFDGDKYSNFGMLTSSSRGIIFRAEDENGIIKFLAGGSVEESPERMRITSTGNVGIGTDNPTSRFQVADGDVYIENIEYGVIMKSPNGSCWRMTINDDGSIKTTSIVCPN